jgi:hypothetical protein
VYACISASIASAPWPMTEQRGELIATAVAEIKYFFLRNSLKSRYKM